MPALNWLGKGIPAAGITYLNEKDVNVRAKLLLGPKVARRRVEIERAHAKWLSAATQEMLMKTGHPLESKASSLLTPVSCGRSHAADQAVASRAAQSDPGLVAASLSDFDAEKVQALRQAIENGTFQVDAYAIACRLMSDACQLLRRLSH